MAVAESEAGRLEPNPTNPTTDFIVFLYDPTTRPGEVDETDPQSYDRSKPMSTPPEGAPDDVLGWYTFSAARADWYRYYQSPMHFYRGTIITREEYLLGRHDRGPMECQNGQKLWIRLTNGAIVPYRSGDCNHMIQVLR